MAKNLRRQKIQFLPCAFLVSRHGMFKIHLSQCVFLVFWRCVFFAYVWCICDAIFAKKCIFFTRLAPVSRPGVFFYALGTCVLCRCIYFTRVWKSDLHVLVSLPWKNGNLRSRIFLPAHCAFFLESAFLDCTCGNKNQIFAASVFWQHMFS